MIYSVAIASLAVFVCLEFLNVPPIVKGQPLGVQNTLHKSAFILIALYLFFIAAFRFETGRDWQPYLHFFNNFDSQSKTSSWERGFVALNGFFKHYFTGSFYAMQVFTLAFCSFAVYRNFLHRSEFPLFLLLLYVVLYFFQTDMAQTRQHIAMAILIYGFPCIEKKKPLLWAGVVLLAMQFHISAVLLFPMYFTSRIVIKGRTALIMLFVAFFLTLFGLNLVRMTVQLTSGLPFMPPRLSAILNGYLNSKKYGQQVQFGTGLGFMLRYAFFAIMIFFYSKKTQAEKSRFFLLNFMIGVLLNAMSRNFDQFGRVAKYFLVCGNGMCAYGLLIDCKQFFKKLDILRVLMCLLFFALQLFTFVKGWYAEKEFFNSYHKDYTPYKTFLLEEQQL